MVGASKLPKRSSAVVPMSSVPKRIHSLLVMVAVHAAKGCGLVYPVGDVP
jgi:hypothetical protein